MSEVAALGLAVDSEPVSRAVTALRSFAPAAAAAATGADQFATSVSQSETRTRAIQAAADRAGISFKEMEARIRATTSSANDNSVAFARQAAEAKRIAAEVRSAWTQSLAASDPVFKAQIAMERDLARQRSVGVDAVKLGITTQEASNAQLDKVRQKNEGVIQIIREQTGQLSTNEKAWLGVKNATSGVSGQLIAMSAGAGPVGVFLAALGPWGLAAAVGIGAASAAISHMISEAKRMGDGALALRTFSETTQLSITQIKALGRAGTEFGVGTDSIAASVDKFSINMEEARKSSGELYDAVRLISGGLAKELAATTTTAQAWDVLAKARAAASDQSKNVLSRAAFGKGGIDTGLVLDVTNQAGGLDAIVARQQKINGLSDDAIKKWATTKVQIDEAQKRTANLMASTYTQDVLDRMLQAALLEERVTRAIIAGTAERQKSVSGQYDPMGNFTPGAGTPASPLETAKSNLGAGLAAGQKPDLSGYDALATKIWAVVDAEKAEQDQRKRLRDAAISDSNLTKEEIGYLGTAATADERRTLRLKELLAARLSNVVSEVAYNRAVSAVNLDTAIEKQSAHNAVLGGAATLTDVLNEKMLTLAKARQQDPTLTQKQIDTQLQITAAQNSGLASIHSMVDAENIRIATLGMSDRATLAYSVAQTEINRQLAAGRSLQDINVAGIRAAADEYARVKTKADLYVDTLQTVKDGYTELGKAALSAALSGANGMHTLTAALDGVAKKLSDKAFENLLSFDPEKMAVGLVQAGASALISAFTRDQKNAEALKKARDEWAKAGPAFQAFLKQMSGGQQGSVSKAIADASAQEAAFEKQAWDARDIAAINAARAGLAKFSDTQKTQFAMIFDSIAKGFETGMGPDSAFLKSVNTVKSSLESTLGFIDDAKEVFGDAAKGENGTAAARAAAAAQTYLLALLKTPEPLSQVQQGLQAIQGTASALQSALVQLGMSSGDAAKAISEGVTKAVSGLKAQFEAGLTERLNTANGQSFLTDATKLIAQHQQDVLDAASLGSDPALIAAVFHAEAQKIVDDAGLVGDAFTNFTTQFPELAGVVVAATSDLSDSAKQIQDQMNGIARTIVEFVSGLYVSANSPLSPLERFAATQTSYNATLGLAQTGDLGAQARVTTDAQNYLEAAKAVYASSAGFQSIFQSVTTQLLALPSVQGTTDPAVQVLRDVLTAIGIGNAALHAANDNTTISLIPAVNAGSASAVATALASYFQAIDPTGQLALLFGKAAETSSNTRAGIDGIDRNNNLTVSGLQIADAANSLIATANNIAIDQRVLLDAIKGLQSTAAGQLQLLTLALAPSANAVVISYTKLGAGTSSPTPDHSSYTDQMLTVLYGIKVNTWATAGNTALMAQIQGSTKARDGSLAAGGLVTGAGTGTSDSISMMLSNREFVIKNAAVEKFGVGFFELLNAGIMPRSIGNDNFRPAIAGPMFRSAGNNNAALLARIDNLTNEVTKLREENKRGHGNSAAAALSGAANVRESVDRVHETQKDIKRNSNMRP